MQWEYPNQIDNVSTASTILRAFCSVQYVLLRTSKTAIDLYRIPVLKLRLRVISHRSASTEKQLDFE